MPLLTLLDAELAYGLHPLLDRAGLTVRAGERIGLIGRNGTGKSSLLKVIAGELALDGGEIRRREGLGIAVVAQEPALPAADTLRESLARHGRFEQIGDERLRWNAEVRLIEFLHRFSLDEGLRPDAASGGERKRAALALALALEPQLLLLDEPTNHLDIAHEVRSLDLLAQLARARGRAIVMALHDLTLAARYATHAVLMGGEKVDAGAAGALLTAERLSALYGQELVAVGHPRGTAFLPV